MSETNNLKPEEKRFPVCIAENLTPILKYEPGDGYQWFIKAEDVEQYLTKLAEDIQKCGKSLLG